MKKAPFSSLYKIYPLGKTISDIILPLMVMLLVASCEEADLPFTNSNSPIFQVTGKLDGTPVAFVAGEQDYYLFTSFDDAQGVLSYQASFANALCENCGEMLTFRFSQNEALTPLSVISVGTNSVFQNSAPSVNVIGYHANFLVNPVGTPPFNFVWNFGDGTTETTAQTPYQHTFQNAGSYNVCVDITDATGCAGRICRLVNTDGGTSCTTNFLIEQLDTNLFFFNPVVNGVPPFTFEWQFHSANSPYATTTIQPTITYNGNETTFPVQLTVTSSDGCQVSLTKQVNFNNLSVCGTHFSYNIAPVEDSVPPSTADSELNITYTDANGTLYSSAFQPQPAFSYFEILTVEDFLENEKGEKTKKLTIRFACRLFDSNGNFKDLTEGFGTIAVAYP